MRNESRKRKIYNIVENNAKGSLGHITYNGFMCVMILLSLIPLAFKEMNIFTGIIEIFVLCIFLLDYLLRLYVAEIKYDKGKRSFLLHIRSITGIIDLIALVPILRIFNPQLVSLKFFYLARIFKLHIAFKYSEKLNLIIRVIKNEARSLGAVLILALMYIFIASIVMFNIEPDTFNRFFDALYFSTITLTTIGYGDISPVTYMGKLVCMCSALMGIALIALPSSIMVSGFMREIDKREKEKEAKEKEEKDEINQNIENEIEVNN